MGDLHSKRENTNADLDVAQWYLSEIVYILFLNQNDCKNIKPAMQYIYYLENLRKCGNDNIRNIWLNHKINR